MKRKISLILTMVMILTMTVIVQVPVYADDSTPTAFHYQHDPRLNAAAMKDVIVNPDAVYGFSPAPDGSLSAYAAYDWTDPEYVNGPNARQARIAYHQNIQEMYDLLYAMVAAGRSEEEIARAVSTKRNEIRLASYENDPEGLAVVKERNLKEYGHEEGPLPEELYAKYGSWKTVMQKAFNANAGMDACVGLYDDNYDLYVAIGQAVAANEAAATREYTVAAFVDAAGLENPSSAEADTVIGKFADAPDVSAWYRPELAAAVSAQILKGYEDNTLRPQGVIRRIEAFVLLSRCLGDLDESGEAVAFADVPDWAQNEVDRLSRAGLVKGYGDGILGSDDLLTVEQVGILVERIRESASADTDPLPFWTDHAAAKKELVSYVNAVTDENSADYIPVKDRIAVFDLDGTLFCETDPVYFDYRLLYHRVMEDPDYREKASDFEKEVAEKIGTYMTTGSAAAGLEVDHGKAVASAFSGMTLGEFETYIKEFKSAKASGYDGMAIGEAFYQPMVQVVDYLQSHDFTVYIVSGTDRLIVRGLVNGSALSLPNRQIIGSDETIVATHQGQTDGLDYVFTEDDELMLGGSFLIKNLKMNKVSVIMQEIGQQPVLSFGNSTGDSSMAEYVTSHNQYKSLAFMLCCDDTERENGDAAKAEKMRGLCEEYGWIPVSMKNDWKTIYGEGVTRLNPPVSEKAA